MHCVGAWRLTSVTLDAEIGNVSGDASFGVSCPVADAPALLRAASPLID